MGLTDRQRVLLHLVVRRYDRDTNTAFLDPLALEEEFRVPIAEIAEDVDTLEAEGYVQRATPDDGAPSGAWVLVPTDKGVLSAMGLGE